LAEDVRILEEMERTDVRYSLAEGMTAFGAMETYLANTVLSLIGFESPVFFMLARAASHRQA
jgi:hypothetical protein